MVSRESKTKIGKILMAASFLHVISLLPLIPSPINPVMFDLISPLFGSRTIFMAFSGLVGFVIFITGYELWHRNKVDISEI